jgi:hypothetical protein
MWHNPSVYGAADREKAPNIGLKGVIWAYLALFGAYIALNLGSLITGKLLCKIYKSFIICHLF